MGIKLFSSSSSGREFSGPKLFSSGSSSFYCPDTDISPNPNPYRFEVIDIEQSPEYLLLILKYEGCTTYNGHKVLLYDINDKPSVLKMISDKNLDPHFLEEQVSPILRAPYNEQGLELIAKIMEKK